MSVYYTESHEWISIQGKIGTVGITDYAQKELGQIVHIELPKINQSLKAGDEVCVLESTKAAADIYTPVSGIVTEVNENVQKTPTLLNQSAETTGWLYRIELADPSELKNLMTLEKYLRGCR